MIQEHSKNDVADFVHDCPDRHGFLLAFAFVGIVAADNRIYWCFCSFIYPKVIKHHHMQDMPDKAGTPLGHMDFVTVKLAGLLYRRVEAKVGIKSVFGEGNRSKESISVIRTTALKKPTPCRDWRRKIRS